MKAIPLTRTATLLPFLDFLGQGGAPVSRLLSASGICSMALSAPEALLPLQQCSSFVQLAARRTGVEDLGLRVGAAASVTRLGLFGLALSQSLTLNDLIHKLIRLVPMLNSGAHVWVAQTGGDTVELRLRHQAGEGRAQIGAYSLLLLIDAVRLATGAGWRPQQVTLDDSLAVHAGRYEALCEAAINRNEDCVGISLPRQLLAQAVPSRLPRVLEARSAEQEFISTAPSLDFVGSISQTLRSALPRGVPTVEVAADLGGTSVRTLQRRLAENAISYQEVVDRVRFETATSRLREPQAKLSAIAMELGYADAANFTRAFRRWTGISPSSYRRRQTELQG